MKDCQIDIFGVPVYLTSDARVADFCRIVAQLMNFGVSFTIDFDFARLQYLVKCGYLSGRSASYFLVGRCSDLQIEYLRSFISFLEAFEVSVKSFMVFKLWQKQENVVPENMFLFPLVELVSSDLL